MGFPMTGAIAVDGWFKSEGHRINVSIVSLHTLVNCMLYVQMMNGQYTRMGVGIASGCKRRGMDAWIAVALYTP